MGTFRLTASGTFASGETWSTRVHANSTNSLATVLNDWAFAIGDFWTNGTYGVETIYPTGTSLTQARAALLDGTFHETNVATSTLADPGTGTGDSLPEQVCILVSLRTDIAGERGRGRLHLPAPQETSATGGELDSTPATRVSTAIDALFSGMRGIGYQFFVYNTKVSVRDPVLYTEKVITSQEVDRVLRTMRRRVKSRRAIYV
jgi:hypothetical protein